jgi:hypothetical protein
MIPVNAGIIANDSRIKAFPGATRPQVRGICCSDIKGVIAGLDPAIHHLNDSCEA